MHGEQLHAQTINDTIRESVDDLMRSKELRPAMQPRIDLAQGYEQGKDAQLSIELEILPKVEAHSTDGLKLEKLVVPVSDAAVEEALQNIAVQRSAERRVGQEGVSTCRSRGAPYHKKKK